MEEAHMSDVTTHPAPEPETQPPAKKARVDAPPKSNTAQATISFNEAVSTDTTNDERRKEIESGITEFVSPKQDSGFTGVLKQRYTDFQVNEILPDGSVCHLTSLQPPKRKRGDQYEDPRRDRNPVPELADQGNGGTEGKESEQASTEATAIPQEIQEKLVRIFGETTVKEMQSLYNAILKDPSKKPRDFRPVRVEPLQDRQLRTEGHQAIRQAFSSRLESVTDSDGSIKITPAPLKTKSRGVPDIPNRIGKPAWHELGGEYLHFTVYKENKDTMEVVSFLAAQCKVAPKSFHFGGTKDRRAVTSQRVSAYRIHAEHMAAMNKRLKQARVGDFENHHAALALGETNGNEFVIVLRDCNFPGTESLSPEEKLQAAQQRITEYTSDFEKRGFLNYYGLQRFGSFSTSTSTVGTYLLQGDFKRAVDAILEYHPDALAAAQDPSIDTKISDNDKSRALGIHLWHETKDSRRALEVIHRRFSAETNIIRHLGLFDKRTGQLRNATDYFSAIQTIPRNLRLMYVHAYQSLVWNHVAGRRWRLFGDKVVEGDLVLVHEHPAPGADPLHAEPDVDEAGEPIIRPAIEDAAPTNDDYERARPLSASEAASGAYSVFDIVLPLPGFDVEYPKNAVGEEYKTFMASERGGGLDPYDMRRKWRDFSLSGSYRKVLARPKGKVDGSVRLYTQEDEQLATTDADRLGLDLSGGNKRKTEESDVGQPKLVIQASQDDDALLPDANATQEIGTNGHETSGVAEDAPAVGHRLAVILKMQLGSSTYATMALRELLGEGNVNSFKPDFTGGR